MKLPKDERINKSGQTCEWEHRCWSNGERRCWSNGERRQQGWGSLLRSLNVPHALALVVAPAVATPVRRLLSPDCTPVARKGLPGRMARSPCPKPRPSSPRPHAGNLIGGDGKNERTEEWCVRVGIEWGPGGGTALGCVRRHTARASLSRTRALIRSAARRSGALMSTDVAATEAEAPAAEAGADPAAEAPAAEAAAAKPAKEGKAKKPAAPRKPRSNPTHPPYAEMVSEAITTLKERTGSSQYAIGKFIEEKHKAHLPPNFRKQLLVQLKKLVAAGKLTKVKNSYKLPPTRAPAPATDKPKPKPKAAARPKPKPKAAAKPKAPAKPKAKASAKPKAAAKRKPTAKPNAAAKPKAPAKPAAKPKAAPKPKAKPAAKSKAKAASKPKAAAVTKTKATSAPARSRSAKAAKTSTKDTPGKKAAPAAKKPAAAAKKAAPAKKAAAPARKVPARKAKK